MARTEMTIMSLPQLLGKGEYYAISSQEDCIESSGYYLNIKVAGLKILQP